VEEEALLKRVKLVKFAITENMEEVALYAMARK